LGSKGPHEAGGACVVTERLRDSGRTSAGFRQNVCGVQAERLRDSGRTPAGFRQRSPSLGRRSGLRGGGYLPCSCRISSWAGGGRKLLNPGPSGCAWVAVGSAGWAATCGLRLAADDSVSAGLAGADGRESYLSCGPDMTGTWLQSAHIDFCYLSATERYIAL
jgi:hypothetical protein